MWLRLTRESQVSTRLDWKACLEKQRRQSGLACVTMAWQVSRTACLKAGGGSFGQLERCSSECQSVAQTDQGERSTRLGWTGMFRWHVLPCQQGKNHVSGEEQCRQSHVACLPNSSTGRVPSFGQLFRTYCAYPCRRNVQKACRCCHVVVVAVVVGREGTMPG